MGVEDLTRSWLTQLRGASEQGPAGLASVLERIRIRPWPVRMAAATVAQAVEWIGPAALTGRCSRASRLDAADRTEFMHRLQGHRSPVVRGAWLLVLGPILEALLTDQSPSSPPHPLAGLLTEADETLPGAVDVVVVGSGAGGAPVAAVLAQRGLSVLVVERGTLVEAASAPDIVARHYLHQGLVASVSNSLAVVLAARAVGGTTPVNSGTCLRPSAAFLEQWHVPDGAGLTLEALAPWLDQAEERSSVCTPGPELISASGLLFAQGLRNMGRSEPFPLPRNALGCSGRGRCCFGCPGGAKRGTDVTYLPTAVAHGAKIVTGSVVERIQSDPTGVHVTIRGQARRQRILARHVVVAGGAIETPALLRRSGLGSWRQAGDSLRIHPTTKVFAWFPGVKHGADGVPQGLGYHPPELPRVALEGIHTPACVSAPLLAVAGRRMPWWLERIEELATFGMMVCDRGTGRVRETMGYSRLDYALHPQDAHDMVAAMKLTGQAFFAAGAERVLLPMAGVTAEFASPAELERLDPGTVPTSALTAIGFHPQGTAAIGRIVGADQRLPGCEQVSVCDASLLPGSPGVNPQLTVMALALRHADLLARSL